jgi:AraC-like DNA-binding protein
MLASDRVMWINADRVFYAGLLGSPTERTLGALVIYVAVDAPIRVSIAGGPWQAGDVAIVPPYSSHRVACETRTIIDLLIEPETVALERLPEFMQARAGIVTAEEFLQRVRAMHRRLVSGLEAGHRKTIDFDVSLFGHNLPARAIDPRIAAVLHEINRVPLAPVGAEYCATSVQLSYSRFLHLFKQETRIAFRIFRSWKRARSLLYYVTGETNLTDVALNAGYPDSSHFSHSIRQVYGLKPKDIFAGSRKLAVYSAKI